MTPGTEAAEMVNSYPMSATNYPEAVYALKERFGRNDLLLQEYVLELLTLVISNATSNQRIPLSKLYLKLESYSRALATLQLDAADPATWLFPLVESSLSEDTLKAWQRSTYSKEDGGELNPPKSRLDYLMEFIKFEVQSDQQITLARRGFQSVTVSSDKKGRGKKTLFNQEKIPTAAGLLNSPKDSSCVFCEKKHDSDRCIKAQSLSLEDRKTKIKEKNACFLCLRPGHGIRKCTAKIKCLLCNGRHLPILCSGIAPGPSPKIPEKEGDPNQPPPEVKVSSSQANQCSADVLLCAILVRLETGSSDIIVRLVGDTGNQRSYIRSDRHIQSARKVGTQWLRNKLFGAITTAPQCYSKFSVTLKGLNRVNRQTLELLEKPVISGRLPKVPNGPWIRQLAQKGITLYDLGDGHAEVDILLVNVLWDTILTGRQELLGNGLYATETIFGWTLGGPISGSTHSSIAAITVSSMITTQGILTLWSLESLGIKEAIEAKSNEQEEREALTHFSRTVERDRNGRYIVSLPWKTGKANLPTNRAIAEAKLRQVTYKLKNNSKLSDYHEVFVGWKNEKIITKVEDVDSGPFLCHRPVYKKGSSTPTRPVFVASCRQGISPSLNDCLYKSPNQLEQIPSLLLRFREKRIGVTADRRKAFLMIKVKTEDQDFQKFL